MKLTAKEHKVINDLLHSYYINNRDENGKMPKEDMALYCKAKTVVLNANIEK